MELNAEQQAMATTLDGVIVAIAGPGSGKTKTICQRFVNLLMAGVAQRDILSLTFTSAAAEEMGRRTGLIDTSVFRTFHSFALEMLKAERSKLSFETCETILPWEMQDYDLLFELTKEFRFKTWRTLQEKISLWKRAGITPEQAIAENPKTSTDHEYANAYDEYENRSRAQGWLDYDSLLQEAVWLLERDPEVRQRWAKRYVQVDEAQDTSEVQYRMVDLIHTGNLCCVGDTNQLIYEWRNAKPDSLKNLHQSYPGARRIFLGTNYRSTQKLVAFLKEILPEDNGIASHMVSMSEEGVDPTFTKYESEQDEVEGIIKAITDFPNSAILARTNRKLHAYQRWCTLNKIPYRFLGKKDFWEQNEIKKLLQTAKNEEHNYQGWPAQQALKDIIKRKGLIQMYERLGYDPNESNPIDNLDSIVRMAGKHQSLDAFQKHITKLTHARKARKGDPALTLATVHQAKGREWRNVYVVSCSQGVLPHVDGDLPEERRIFFVACSRAAKELHISWHNNPSMFIVKWSDQFKTAVKEVQNGEI